MIFFLSRNRHTRAKAQPSQTHSNQRFGDGFRDGDEGFGDGIGSLVMILLWMVLRHVGREGTSNEDFSSWSGVRGVVILVRWCVV